MSAHSTLPSMLELAALTPNVQVTIRYICSCITLLEEHLLIVYLVSYLKEHGFFYETMSCVHGTTMTLNNFTRDGFMWQCPSAACGCRPGKGSRERRALKSGSFFSNRNLGVHLALQGLWGLLHGMSQQTITSMLRTSRITVRRLARDYHLLLEADLTREDMHVGKFQDHCCMRFII